MNVAYISQGKLYLASADGGALKPPREILSNFARQSNERANRMAERHGWKARTSGEPEMIPATMLWRTQAIDPSAQHANIGSVTTGLAQKLIYCMRLGTIGGLFEHDRTDGSERRLFHGPNFSAADLARHPTRDLIAMSIRQNDGTANIATADADGGKLREITEGDSLDEAPSWAPGDGQTLVFQSAGVARNAAGMMMATGAYAIEQLNLDSGEMTTLIQHDQFDFLSPRLTADGNLLVIRRPYEPSHRRRVSPAKVAMDIVCFPYRLARTFVAFFHFMSMAFARKPLITAGGPEQEPKQPASMMLWGKMIDAQRAMKSAGSGSDAAALVPRTWELIRIDPDGRQASIAQRVGSFDLTADGAIVYTDGSRIFRIAPDGSASQEICNASLIERVIACE